MTLFSQTGTENSTVSAPRARVAMLSALNASCDTSLEVRALYDFCFQHLARERLKSQIKLRRHRLTQGGWSGRRRASHRVDIPNVDAVLRGCHREAEDASVHLQHLVFLGLLGFSLQG